MAKRLATSGTGVAATGGVSAPLVAAAREVYTLRVVAAREVSASGVGEIRTAQTVAGTGVVGAEIAKWCGGGVRGAGGNLEGGELYLPHLAYLLGWGTVRGDWWSIIDQRHPANSPGQHRHLVTRSPLEKKSEF